MTTSKGARTPKGAEPARLLFVSAGLSPRGGGIAAAGRLLLDATRQWAESRGVPLRVLTLGDADELPTGIGGESFAGSRAALVRAVWRSQFFEGYRHHVYDFLGMARIQGVLPRGLRARYLLYLYGIECWRPLRGSRRRALVGAVTRLACSAYTIQRMRKDNPQAPVVVPLHLALGDRSPGRGEPQQDLLAQLGERFVLIVGRLAPGERYKGHDQLLAAMARLVPEHPDLQLVIVGDGADRARLEAQARALGVAERVVFTGYVDDATLDALYRRCTVFAMPSAGEGFGFVYLEAMRAAKPCVALSDSAAAEIIVDGETGRLVAPGVDALTAALAALLADPAMAANLGAAGRIRWERHFQPALFSSSLGLHLDTLVAMTPDRSRVTNPATERATDSPSAVQALAPARSSASDT